MAAFADLVRFFPTLGGTTDWVFSSAVGGCQSPSAANVQAGLPYRIYSVSNDLTQWEVSVGVVATVGTFPRTTVLYNSSGTGTAPGQSGAGTKVSFSTVPQVSVVALAEDLRMVLTANTTFYVATTGSDTANTGFTVGSPWLTLQHAANFIKENVDLNGYVATVQVAAGTYSFGVQQFGSYLGGDPTDPNGGVIFSGDTTTPSNVLISTTNANCFVASFGAHFGVQGFKMTAATSGSPIYASAHGRININGKLEFGAVAATQPHIFANTLGWVGGGANYIVSGAANVHVQAYSNAVIEISGVTITLAGSGTINYWAFGNLGGEVYMPGCTFSGAGVTVTNKYVAQMNGLVYFNGATLPGTNAGTTNTGGQAA